MNINISNETPAYILQLTELGVRDPVCSLIRSKAGISLYRVESEGKNLILKVFENQEDTREIDNYLMLSKLEIPTLPLLGYTKNTILLPDVESSDEYRLGKESDLSDPKVARAIAKWYRLLHKKGSTYLLGRKIPMYDETDLLTADNMKLIAEKTGTTDNRLWQVLTENYSTIRSRIDALPRTLTYNDFYWTNLIVSKNGESAFMFDYNLLGKGIAYGDIRNVTSSLSSEAAEAFLQEYGDNIAKEQKKADAVIAPLVTLVSACECETFPSWAKASLAELENGDISRHLTEWLSMETDTMLEAASQIIKSNFGRCAGEIKKFENVTNNFVYSFTASDKHYILKLYRSTDWPEEGKIQFVNQLLTQNNIPHADLIAYSRNDRLYPNGYLIEREVQGIAADKLIFDREQETMLYVKLAELVSSIHNIRIKNYGYIGSGIACYESMTSFFEDEFDRLDNGLKQTISEPQFRKMKEKFFKTMRDFDDLPSVLCHSDLSKKNIIVQDNGEILLIDWDDAIAFNWMADIARLTFWMKLNYNEQDRVLFRSTFLKHYRTTYHKSGFDIFERAFHIYSALDSLIFFRTIGDKEMEDRLKSYLDDLHLR